VTLPAWLALTVQVPGPRSVISAPFVPPAVQTAGVDVVNVSARPDEAVALTVTGDWAIVAFARLPNVMAWSSFRTRTVNEFDAADETPEPAAFRALTVHAYARPLVSPPTTTGLPERGAPPLLELHAAE
jgi:hypothetical protein